MEGRQIHEAIGVAQEGLHSMKSKNIKGAILKIDLSKAYDKVRWLYIRMLLSPNTSWFWYFIYQVDHELYYYCIIFGPNQWGGFTLFPC